MWSGNEYSVLSGTSLQVSQAVLCIVQLLRVFVVRYTTTIVPVAVAPSFTVTEVPKGSAFPLSEVESVTHPIEVKGCEIDTAIAITDAASEVDVKV